MAQRAEIGRRIGAWRTARGWSVSELSRAASVPRRTIDRIEAGEAASWWATCAVLRALGVDDRGIVELVRDSGEAPGDG